MCRAQEPRPPTVVEGRVTRPSDPKVGLFIISLHARNAEDRILTETQDRSEIVGQHEVHRSAELISQSHPGSIPHGSRVPDISQALRAVPISGERTALQGWSGHSLRIPLSFARSSASASSSESCSSLETIASCAPPLSRCSFGRDGCGWSRNNTCVARCSVSSSTDGYSNARVAGRDCPTST